MKGLLPKGSWIGFPSWWSYLARVWKLQEVGFFWGEEVTGSEYLGEPCAWHLPVPFLGADQP